MVGGRGLLPGHLHTTHPGETGQGEGEGGELHQQGRVTGAKARSFTNGQAQPQCSVCPCATCTENPGGSLHTESRHLSC
jgi:hypothetical protein